MNSRQPKNVEEVKEIALAIAGLINHFLYGDLKSEFKKDKKRFLKGCALYWDHSEDLHAICFALGNGVAYIADQPEAFGTWTSLIQALQNPVIPQSAKDQINTQIAKLGRPKPAPVKREPSKTRIYLMRNGRNGLFKIGASQNPQHRERTLQSEEPEVHLIEHWPGTMKDEEDLHLRFAEVRVRGEWFRLNAQQVKELLSTAEAAG